MSEQQNESAFSTPTITEPKNTINFTYILHLVLTVGSWFAPFLVSWPLLLTAYGCVMLQFITFDRCLLNAGHDLPEENNNTFYGHLLHSVGFEYNKAKVKFFVRTYLYYVLTAVTVLWQIVLGNKALWF